MSLIDAAADEAGSCLAPSPPFSAPPRKIRIASIEACRAIAATMVVATHAGVILAAPADFGIAPFGQFFRFGRSGVDFFFVLSGFLIGLLHWRDIGRPERLERYALRRFTRIYPTYWLVLLLVVPVDVFTHTLFDGYGKPVEVLKSILLLPQHNTILDVTWSLRNEILFYALFGLLIVSRRIGAVVVSVWTVGLVIRPFVAQTISNPWLDLLSYPMNIEFVIGIAAGFVFSHSRISRPFLVLSLGLIIFSGLWFLEDQSRLINPGKVNSPARLGWDQFFFVCTAYGLAASAVIIGLSTLEETKRIRLPRLLEKLGGASYLLYLIHAPALVILGASERILHLLRFAAAWVLGGVYIAVVMITAIMMHSIIEKPMLRIIRKPPAGALPAPSR